MGEENEKEAKRTCGFKTAEEENQTVTSKENSNKIWSSNAQNIKETGPKDNMKVTSSTGPLVNYQEGHNIPAKEHELNLSEKTDNLIMIYNKNRYNKSIYRQTEKNKPESFNNHNIDRPNI